MSTTNWIFEGAQRYKEFREEVGAGDDGSIVYQKIQARTVYQFRRHQFVEMTSTVTLDEGDVGDDSTGVGINAYQGDYQISSVVVIGGSGVGKWICMADDIEPTTLGINCYKRSQTWEKRDVWEDYDWPGQT